MVVFKKNKQGKYKKLTVFIISLFLILELTPTLFSSTTGSNNSISRHVGDYGVLQNLDLVLQDKEGKAKSAQIENETKSRLDQFNLVEYQMETDVPEYEIRSLDYPEYASLEPIIFEAIYQNPIINNTSILDFLLDQPFNYWIYTSSENRTTWTKALLRPSIIFPKFNPWRWEPIDVDGNLSNGNEIQVRFDIILDTNPQNYTIELPRPLQGIPGKVQTKGGFGLTIERLVNRSFPLEVYIIKSISYEGKNYIWNTGVKFSQMPNHYKSELLADKIELSGMASKLISNFTSIWDLFNSTLAEINGPYSLRYQFDDDLTFFNIMAGLVRFENLTLSDKNWLLFFVTPAPEEKYIVRSGEVWVDSSNIQAPVDNLKWTSGIYESLAKSKIPINLRILYGELRNQLILADVNLVNVPKWFEINIDYTKVVEGNNITVLDYSAEDLLTSLNYTSYLFPDYFNEPRTANCTHVYLSSIPKKFHIEMTTDIGRDINTSLYRNPQAGVVSNLIDNLISRVANRFYRIGRYLKLITEGLLELPSDKGWAIINAYDAEFSYIEFYQTSKEYIDTEGNYFAFYNISNSKSNLNINENNSINSTLNGTNSAQPIFAVSGRLIKLSWANISFAKPLELELKAMDNQPFKGLFVDGEDYVLATISNVPGYINILNYEDRSVYTTIDKNSDQPEDNYGQIIDKFEFTSRIGNDLMKLQINHIPSKLEFNRESKLISFTTGSKPDDYVKDITFYITSDSSKPTYQLINSDYMFIYQQQDYITASGRISGIKNLTFDQTENGYIELLLNHESQLQIMLVNMKDEHTKAKMIIDPIPTRFKLTLPGIIKTTNIQLPDMTNMTGFLDYTQLVFTLGKLGNELVTLLGNLSQNLVDSIGNIGVNFSISYDLESYGSTLDMVAEIERGGIVPEYIGNGEGSNIYTTETDKLLGNKLGWTHGITMREDVYKNQKILRGHLYLQGMPKSATLSTYFTENRTKVNLDFIGYNPRHDWLLIELQGIHDRDVITFFQKIPDDVDFSADVDLFTNLTIGGEMAGNIFITICDSGEETCSRPLGALYVNMHTYQPIQSLREIYISELPAELDINFALEKEMRLIYKASSEIEFIYSKLSKIITTSWHHVNLIFHDIPREFRFNLFSNTDFDINDPLPLQGMPKLEINTNGSQILDILLSLEGEAVGQRGDFELNLQNVQDTSGELFKNGYRIKSIGLDFIRLKLSELPILDNYKLNSIILESEDLKSLVFKVNLLFGVFPYFDLGAESEGKIEITIDHTLKVFGRNMRAQVAIVDLVYETIGGARIPIGSPIFINNVNSELKRNQQHVLIPAVLVSLIFTWVNN